MTIDRAAKEPIKNLVLLLVFLLSACGGGGSGGGESTQTPTIVDISQQAKIDASSAEGFLVGLRLPFSRSLVRDILYLFIDGSLTFQTGNINTVVANSCGGSVHIAGNLDETLSTGFLTLDFSNYQDCGYMYTYTFNGSIDLSISSSEIYTYGGNITIPAEFLLSTNNLQITFRSVSMNMDGTLGYYHDSSDPQYNWLVFTKNFTLSDSTGSASFMNFIQKFYSSKGNVNPSSYLGFNYSGRMYDSESGYVDVTTVNAVATCESVGVNCPLDPTSEGRIKLSGDNSSALVQFGLNFDIISIDTDGNGVYEQTLNCNDSQCY